MILIYNKFTNLESLYIDISFNYNIDSYNKRYHLKSLL